MDAFAFIIHPLSPRRDVMRKYPRLGRILPVPAIELLSRFWPPVTISHVTGICSAATGKEIEGWLIAVPFTAQQMLTLPPATVYRRIIAAGRLAERLGARILGLGAYTSVVGDGGVTIARALDIAVTSGDSYTAVLAIHAVREAMRRMAYDPAKVTMAVVGATGAIGGVVAQGLARDAKTMVLVGRDWERLKATGERLRSTGARELRFSTDPSDIRQAQVVITVTSAGGNLVRAEHLRPGAIVCDVSRPRDVSRSVAQERDDVLVIDGGLAHVPGAVDFGFDYGLPPALTYGCMAETMVLALEGRFEDYSLGKTLSAEQVWEIDTLANSHGFRLAALRSFEQVLSDEAIVRIKSKAH